MTTQVKSVAVRLKVLSGLWETVGVDRLAGIVPEIDSLVSDEWGSATASFNLHRDPGTNWPDLGAFADVEIDVAGVKRWTGRISQTPQADGDEPVVNVQCEGWRAHLDDDTYRRAYVKTRLADFKDIRGIPGANLGGAAAIAGAQVTTEGRQVYLAIPNGAQVTPGAGAFASLDLGPGPGAKRVTVSWTSSNSSGSVNALCRLSDYPHNGDSSGSSEDAFGFALNTGAINVSTGTVTTPRRYIKLYLYETSFTGGSTPDHWWKIDAISIFTDAAWSVGTGLASSLTAPIIINDALDRATDLLSSDRTGIDPTSAATFTFPEFVLDGQKTPREVIDAANAPLNFRTKIDVDRRMVFEPKPTVATIECGEWPGTEFQDASANSGQDVYNGVVVEGTAADGSDVSVRRSSAQLPGVSLSTTSSPAATNPSFDTVTTGWTAVGGGTITRDTTTFDSSPASGRFDRSGANLTGSELLTGTFSGTFLAGVSYLLTGRIRGDVSGKDATLIFGTSLTFGDLDYIDITTTGSFQSFSIPWTPTTDRTSVTFSVSPDGGTKLWIDTLAVFTAQPTLVDRRGFKRTHVLPIRNSLTQALAEKIGVTWLSAHQTTPLKGTVTVTGDGAVRDILTGRSIAPEELLTRTGDMLRLSHRVDPDTGGQGRDGRIAQVSYSPATDQATVQLDSTRTNVEALLEQLAIVVGSS